MTYPFKYSCQAVNDCVVVAHTVDCCGTIEYVGIEVSKQSAFVACEQAWDQSLPACGCPAGPATAEDGKTVTDPSQVMTDCTNFTQSGGICYTYVP